jgi:hypothetical protein
MNQVEKFMEFAKNFDTRTAPADIQAMAEKYGQYIFDMETDDKACSYAEEGCIIGLMFQQSVIAEPIAVDLALPSGTKWADRNVGAALPEDTGLYFSWGNTDGHEAGKDYDFDDDTYDDTPGAELDGDIDLAHDAARANLGEPWQMPTKDQFEELVKNCECEVCTLNGYRGRRFTSKINGNSIFMPFAGYIYGSGLNGRGSNGYYWSASLYSAADGYNLYFNSGGVNPASIDNRFLGFSVRAVQNIA